MAKSRGRYCGDTELTVYLTNTSGPVPLVLDLLIAHDRFGSSSDPSLNGHLHYPNDIDKSLNETVTNKIRKYWTDYNNKPPTTASFMTPVTSMSGRLHSEFVWLLFLQDHRETDRFFAASGVQLAQTDRGEFHFRRVDILLLVRLPVYRAARALHRTWDMNVPSSPAAIIFFIPTLFLNIPSP